MSFDEVRFPTNISYGSHGGPGFKTDIIATDSGAEERISRWSGARRQYDVSYGIKSYADMTTLIAFFIARNGAANGFRFQDLLDYTTASDHRSACSNLDSQIGIGDGSTTVFQLVTSYTSGSQTRIRNLSKPVTGTVVVALDSVNQASGWTVDTTTGLVTFTTAPTIGQVITAGCQYDVPVRFGDQVDGMLDVSIDDFDSNSLSDIYLQEIRDEVVINDSFFYGGAVETSLSANITLSLTSGRVQIVAATATSLAVSLPDPTALPAGGPYFYIVNSGTNSFAVKNNSGTSLVTLTA